MEANAEIPLPVDKLSIDLIQKTKSSISDPRYAVLVSSGSFNPPTYMHLRMFELARDELTAQGYTVLGGYLSPVNDEYKKKDLISGMHRIRMCELACKSSSFVTVDPWEAKQSSYQRNLEVLARIQSSLLKSGIFDKGSLKVMLLCGSDLLERWGVLKVWIADELRTICKDFGVVCIRREGMDIDKIICNNEILSENKNNIISVDEIVPNQISSTRVRECIRKGLSVKYLICDEVIDYVKDNQLYLNPPDN
ncbi:nicotinamide/nicotinic acid mononucleotide adenylyltransferase-like isoform X3 [Carex rostrata]